MIPALTHAVLGKLSSRVISQRLPPYQEEAEEIIAQKFVKVLNQHFGRRCSEPTKNLVDDFPDCTCEEDGQRVGIELEEVTSASDAKAYQDGIKLCDSIMSALRAYPNNPAALKTISAQAK